MNVLIATFQAGGGSQPALGIGRLLAERGHSVRILAPAAYAARVTAGGCEPRPLPPEAEFDVAGGRAMEDQRAFLGELFFGEALPDALAAELAAEPADVLVVDYLLQSLVHRAEQLPPPHVLLVHTIRSFNADDDTDALIRNAAGTLVAIPSEFDCWPDPPAGVVHVGWITEASPAASWDSPWPAGDDRPLVVVSMGTTYMHQEDVLARIALADAGLDARVLILTGLELAPEEVGSLPGVEVRGYVPHSAVLRDAALVVTHAGTGTLLAAFSAGVPAVCVPLGRDQRHNARRVEELGLGVALPTDAPATEIGAALTAALASTALRDEAQRMGDAIRAYGGGVRAVAELERLG